MTTLEPRSRKFVGFLSWFSTGSDGDRSNIRPSTHIAQESSLLDAGRLSLTSPIAVRQCAGSARLRSGASSVAIKSP